MLYLSQCGLLPDSLNQALPQVFPGVRDNHNAGAGGVRKNVVRTIYPVELPANFFDFPDKVCAIHVCMVHTGLNWWKLPGTPDDATRELIVRIVPLVWVLWVKG
jgi:hypothetical protein